MKTHEEVLDIIHDGNAACNHVNNVPKLADFEKITKSYWADGCYGPEHNCGLVGLLKDGRWVAIEEWEDTSGHGCRCDVQVLFFNSEEEAIRLGISSYEQDKLN